MADGTTDGAASLQPLSGSPRQIWDLLRRWWATSEEAHTLMVRTSGSTGEPKDVVLSKGALIASAQATHAVLGGAGSWTLTLPPNAVAGLQVLVRSLLAGAEPIWAAEFSDLSEALAANAGERRYVSLVPTQLHRLAHERRLDVLADYDAVLVGGAATPPRLRQVAADAGVRLVRTYGMSETCGGCVYDGRPLPTCRVRIDGDGQILIAGPILFEGYRGATRQGKWWPTGDLGVFDDGILTVTGRVDDVVKVGGAKVVLPHVERAILALAQVDAAAVVAVPDDRWGSRVVAFVRTDESELGDVNVLRTMLIGGGLHRWSTPQQIVVVDDLPLLPGGKVDRVELARRAATHS